MKKSEMFRLAQQAVIESSFANDIKLQVLRVLMEEEGFALHIEEAQEEQDRENQP